MANKALVSVQNLSSLDLALMPDYARELYLRYAPDPPSAEDIQAAWDDLHNQDGDVRVYFVQRGYDLDAPIKIGMAKRPARRIAELQTACAEKLVVLAICRGSKALERHYHEAFAKYRVKGEWFSPSPAIMQEIDRLAGLRIGRPKPRLSTHPVTNVGRG